MFARKFRSGKETFVELLFLPNFLYFRKSVLKKLRVSSLLLMLIILFSKKVTKLLESSTNEE